jgi:hypothetical protein
MKLINRTARHAGMNNCCAEGCVMRQTEGSYDR